MSDPGDEVMAAVDANDPVRVAAALDGLPESRRRVLNKAIQQRVRDTYDHRQTALGVAALGLAQGAEQAARALGHVDLGDQAALAARVLAERTPPWLEAFSRKALGGRRALRGGWRIVRALIRSGLVPKPHVPEYITFMPHALGGTFAADPTIREALLTDPDLLTDEIFRLFSVEGAADSMRTIDGYVEQPVFHPFGPEPVPKPHLTWRVTLARLADEGHIDRGRLLDACLGAFFCDLPPNQVGWYLGFHDELEPSIDELAARTETYLRLLAADTGRAVALAQRVLRTLLEAGRLDAARFVAAAEPPLYRREKKHVIAQLRLLDSTARKHPHLACQIVAMTAVALEHERLDVQEHALSLVRRHRDAADTETLDRVRLAATSVAPALRARASDVLGIPGTVPQAVALMPAAAGQAPPRVADVRELAETVAELIADPWDPMLIERTLDGVARFAADYDTFVAALDPVVRRVQALDHLPQLRFLSWMLRPDTPASTRRRNFQKGWEVRTEPFWHRPRRACASPGAVLGRRLHEVYTRGWRAESRPLLAYPDTATGHVDPDRILTEMVRLEETGAAPWPADLLQAILRLPRDIDDAVVRRAGELRSPAGTLLAHVVDLGAVPDPIAVPLESASWTVVTLRSETRPPGQVLPAIWDFTTPVGSTWDTWDAEAEELLVWAFTLPSHREVLAAHALPVLGRVRLPPRIHGPLGQFIPLLPDTQGPAGTAVNLALIYAMAAHELPCRAAAAEALIGFAGHGGLDTADLGARMGDLASRRVIMLGRVAECLETALASGAAQMVWEITSAAVPVLLKTRTRDTHRLLSIASDSAAQLGLHAHVDGLTDVAATPGSSRLLIEARRLRDQLAH